MGTRFNRAYLVVPVIYVGVIFGLLFLQFSGGERLTRSVGPVLLRATRDVTGETGDAGVRDVRVEFNGLSFVFDGETGLVLETSDALAEVHPLGFRQTETGFEIEFGGGFSLDIATAEEPVQEVQLVLRMPSTGFQVGSTALSPEDVLEIVIPFRFVGTASPQTSERASFVTVTVDRSEYYFTAPPDAMIDPANEKIVLERAAAGRPIRYVQAVSGNPSTVLGWFADPDQRVSDSRLEASVTRFVDAAYDGWQGPRFNPSSVTWTAPDGSQRFSELALASFLSEAWLRDEYDRAFSEVRRAGDLFGEELNLLSSPFMGNLLAISDRMQREDATTVREIREDLDQARPTVFRRPDLFMTAMTRGGMSLYDDVLEFAGKVNLGSADVTTAVGMLATHSLYSHPTDESRSATSRFESLLETTILGAIVETGRGYFLQSAPGQVDLAVSITAGLAIERIADDRADPTLLAAGRNLVISGLDLADRSGMLPASLVVRGNTVESGEGVIAPEEIYELISTNPHYPHAVMIGEGPAEGLWIWTVVDVEPVTLTRSEWRFRLEYPRLRTHYMYFSNVPAFVRLELFGQTWRDAPDFEIYSKGRHYEPSVERLMVKYYDDSVLRDVAIYF